MTAAAVVVHICEFSSTAMLLLVADREIPENQGLDFPNLWQLDDFSILSATKSEKCKSGIVNK